MRSSQFKFICISCLAVLLTGCSSHHVKPHHGFANAASDPFAGKGSPYYRHPTRQSSIPFGGGRYQVGRPYRVAGITFTPREQPGYDKIGMASWYGKDFHRRRTANGEWFDMNTLTAAHATLPLPSYVLVTNLENDRQVVVRVNDRGPFVGTRVIDLSKRAADLLGYSNKGKARVRVKLIGPAPLQDSMKHMLVMNEAVRQGAEMRDLVAMSGGDSNNQVAYNDGADNSAPPSLRSDRVAQEVARPIYVVRVGVFHDLANAQSAYDSVSGFGPVKIVNAVGANGPMYRVEMGPLDNQADADSALTTAQSAGFEGAKLVSEKPQRISLR